MQYVSNLLLELILRKIEARISEIKGYCEFLKNIAPDEYKAYCALADKIGFDRRIGY